jgi:hypothetical protein
LQPSTTQPRNRVQHKRAFLWCHGGQITICQAKCTNVLWDFPQACQSDPYRQGSDAEWHAGCCVPHGSGQCRLQSLQRSMSWTEKDQLNDGRRTMEHRILRTSVGSSFHGSASHSVEHPPAVQSAQTRSLWNMWSQISSISFQSVMMPRFRYFPSNQSVDC